MQPFSVIIIQSQTHLPGISRKKEVQPIHGIEVGFRFKIHEAILLPKKVQTNKVQQYTCHSNSITYVSNFSKLFYLCCISGTYAIVSKNPSKYFVLCHHEKYLQNILEFFFNGWQNPRQYVYSRVSVIAK